MISDFAHDIEALNEARKKLEKAINEYLESGRQITYLAPEPEPEAIHAEWMNNSRRAKLMTVRAKRQGNAERAA